MFTGIEEQFLEHTAAAAFQIVWDGIKGVKGLVGEKNAIQRGMREYARKFLERYGNVKVLNMDRPVPLSEIYVAAQVISPRVAKSFRSVEELHELFLQAGQRHLFLGDRNEGRSDCLDLANGTQFLNVLGAPGAGKSTFLRRLGLEALRPRRAWDDSILRPLGLKAGLPGHERSRYTHDCLPILIELRRFRTDEIDLVQLLQKELTICALPESDKLIRALLEGGRLLLLLDGVDEIPGDRLEKAITHIRDFVDRYSGNRFVTSCRTAFYRDYFPRFREVLLADFDDDQIAGFVRNWFRSEEDRKRGVANEFLKVLADPANASAKELASTPLLLTFLCLAYDDRQRLPPNRSELYRQALEILMERWAASKRVHNEPVYRELHARLEVQLLAEVAAPAFSDNRYFFTRRELTERISGFLRDELNAPKHLDADQVLDAIEIQQGLIVQRAQDAWSFSHLTLQEYLTAVWYEGNQQIEELINKHLFDLRWREVFILLAGSVSKADDLLQQMQGVAEKVLADSPWAIQCVRWAADKTAALEDASKGAANRALALSWAMAIARVHAISPDRDQSLDTNLDMGIHFVSDSTTDLRFQFTRALILARAYSSAEFDLELDLDTYLYIHFYLDRALDRDMALARVIESAKRLQELLLAMDKAHYWLGPWRESEKKVRALSEQLDSDCSSEKIHMAWGHLRKILEEALQLPPDPPDLPKELDALWDYLYVHQLILDCQNAATRVSRPGWDKICRRMLNPPEKPSPKDSQALRRRKTRRT